MKRLNFCGGRRRLGSPNGPRLRLDTMFEFEEEETALAKYVVERPTFLFVRSKFRLIITNEVLIFTENTSNNKIRRRVPIEILSGMSKKLSTSSKSLVIHISGHADEFVYTSYRDDIIDLVKRLYAYKMKKNLPIFAPAETGLKDYCTTDTEAEQGLTRMPERSKALASENVYIEYSDDEKESDDTDYVSNFLKLSFIRICTRTNYLQIY